MVLKKIDNFIFVINGSGGVGKDTFVNLVEEILKKYKIKIFTCEDNENDFLERTYVVESCDSVSNIKVAATFLGWDNSQKTEKDRKFLSDLKALATKYYDSPFKLMENSINHLYEKHASFPQILFLHIREPEEIQRVVNGFGAKTILVKRDSVEHITSNAADANVFNYTYDYVIENNGTIEDLKDTAERFLIKVGILEEC